jgi:acetylornithine/LysW-gamma-L-lysine aminotransferase
VILEIVQGEGGVHVAPEGYISEARKICDDRGALLIIDEVQTGLGRTGTMFAVEKHSAIPDMICLGKSLGGGIPLAAVIINRKLGPIPTGLHGSTFGGSPIACAAGNAVLDYLTRNEIPSRSDKLGKVLIEGLKKIDSPVIREVRGTGLMAAVELKTKAGPYLSSMLENGVAAIPSGSTIIRLLPPLVITEEEINRTVRILGEVLNG